MAKFGPGNKAAVGHGRPKAVEEFREKARKAVDEHVLKAWIDEVTPCRRVDGDGPLSRGKEWVKCSELLAAYGYGKPAQPVEHSDPEGNALSLSVRLIKPDGSSS